MCDASTEAVIAAGYGQFFAFFRFTVEISPRIRVCYGKYGNGGNEMAIMMDKKLGFGALHHGKASECLHCGLCEKNCPQRIAIREMLEEFAGLYEG